MINIALDGPSGAGKSTIAKAVADKLNILYLDTGAMYRALGLKALKMGIDPSDRQKVALKIVGHTDISVRLGDNGQCTLMDGEDVTGLIRTPEVSLAASNISALPEVRMAMVELQRSIASETDMILDGRDIGTFVLPDTKYKFFLTAKAEERARRRYTELIQKGTECTYEEVLSDMLKRDENDTKREFAPLRIPEDALLIDSTDLTIDEVADIIIKNVKKR